MGVQQPPLTVLRRLDHLYFGPVLRKGAPELPAPFSLKALGADLGVEVAVPPREAFVLVIGDPGCGKSSFINAVAQEVVLPVGGSKTLLQQARPPLTYVRAEGALAGAVPRVLAEAAQVFPNWFEGRKDGLVACCGGCSASPQLAGIEIMEAALPGDTQDAQPLAWLAARADLIVCLLDPQKQPSVSEVLLQWLARCVAEVQPPPALQFVLSKADLVPREALRIRLVAKASKLLTEHLGCGYVILPVATGDLNGLLDGLDSAPSVIKVGSREFTLPEASSKAPGRVTDAGPLRTVQTAQECAARKVEEGLRTLQEDCGTLAKAIDSNLEQARARDKPSVPLRYRLYQYSGAMIIVALLLPFALEEDVDPNIVQMWVCLAGAVAALLLIFAFMAPAPGVSSQISSSKQLGVSALEEQTRFVQLVLRQHALWVGDSAAAPTAGSAAAVPSGGTEASVTGCTNRSGGGLVAANFEETLI